MSPAHDSALARLGSLGGSGGRSRPPRRRGGHRRRGSRASTTRAARGLALPAAGAVAAVVVVFGLVQWLRPAPSVTVHVAQAPLALAGTPTLPWPTQGEAAMAVDGVGMVGSSGTQNAVPIASITKVMTALLVLRDHPLSSGQSGPSIAITAADVASYQRAVALQESVLPVTAGEQLTELQALQALLIPSANNIARVLARWDAGSITAFVAKMNAEAASLGLHHTHFVGPSGFAPGSTSTPDDLIHLGQAAMANPVFASVVAMPAVTLPVAGTVENYDYNLGHGGFVGIKTGSDGHAGGCFLFQATVPAAGGSATIVGAVLGQQTAPIIQSALDASSRLVAALAPQLTIHQLVRSGQQVAEVTTPWGQKSPVVTTQSLSTTAWPGMHLQSHITLDRLGSAVRQGQRIGTLTVLLDGSSRAIPLVAANAVGGPGFGYKLGRF